MLLVFTFSALAQTEKSLDVKGKVTDQQGKPVPYAHVSLAGTKHKVMTDMNGVFTFTKIPYGKYTLEIQMMGFQKLTRDIQVNAKTSPLKLTLKENVQQLKEAVVEAPKTEAEEIEESGFSVDVIEMEEAEKQSIQTNDLLDQTAGVRIRQDGGLGSRVRYNLNGLSGNSVRIFIDGIPIENYGYSFSLNSIPTSMIERVEVYKGVVPAEFGTDALGGAINIILKKDAPNTLNTSYSYG